MISQLGSSVPVKSATFGLASDNFTTNNAQTDIAQDWPILLPVSTLQWRLRVGNPAGAGIISYKGPYVGSPAWSASGIYSFMSAPPTRALPDFAGAASGADIVTPWVTDPTLQFTADTIRVLRLGLTCPGGTVLSISNRPTTTQFGAGASGDVGNATITHGVFSPQFAVCDIRLEYQFRGNQPVVLGVGDSIQTGYQDTLTNNTPSPCNSFLGYAAMRERFAWIDCSAAGKQLSDFTSAASSMYTRYDPTILAQATHIVISLGINDSAAGVPLATFISRYQAVIATAKSLAAPGARVYASTIIPQPNNKPGVLTAGAAAAALTLSTNVPYANADVIDIGKGTANLETGKIVSGASTGNGPYTTTITVATANPHKLAEVVGLQAESLRLDYNAFIRAGVPGADGLFDFDRAIASYAGDPYSVDFELMGTGAIHPASGGHYAMAEAVRLAT